jgi:hypothetical protein
MTQLQDLPSELQLMIFELQPHNLRLAQLLNRSLRELTYPSFIQYWANLPIRLHEFYQYLQTNPRILGLCHSRLGGGITNFDLYFQIPEDESICLRSTMSVTSRI